MVSTPSVPTLDGRAFRRENSPIPISEQKTSVLDVLSMWGGSGASKRIARGRLGILKVSLQRNPFDSTVAQSTARESNFQHSGRTQGFRSLSLLFPERFPMFLPQHARRPHRPPAFRRLRSDNATAIRTQNALAVSRRHSAVNVWDIASFLNPFRAAESCGRSRPFDPPSIPAFLYSIPAIECCGSHGTPPCRERDHIPPGWCSKDPGTQQKRPAPVLLTCPLFLPGHSIAWPGPSASLFHKSFRLATSGGPQRALKACVGYQYPDQDHHQSASSAKSCLAWIPEVIGRVTKLGDF